MPSSYAPLDVEQLLVTLPLADKIKVLAGNDFWHFEDVVSAGIPKVRVSDGPNGVRGQHFFNGTPASCFPASTGVGASFDVELVERIGRALGEECRAKGAHTCNMQRSPLGGRGFESFSEDPVVSGMISSAYVTGVQSKKVVACIKHFVANDQEFERFSMDSVVSQRALRELYLEPFRLAMKHSSPQSFMTSYNKVNGIHASESRELLEDVLRKEWGFKGLTMSDWTGVYSTDTSIKAGLDVEMPGPTTMRGDCVARQLGAGKLFIEDIDACVRNVLNLANAAIASGIPFDAPESSIDTPQLRALLRESASAAIVLLKNSSSLLPISSSSPPRTIAVIGSNAKIPVPSGGGSASLTSTYTISPLEGITEAAKEIGAKVEYATGASAFRYLPLLDPLMTDGKVEFFADSPVDEWFEDVTSKLPVATFETSTKSSLAFMVDNIPYEDLGASPRCRICLPSFPLRTQLTSPPQYTAKFTADTSGTWTFSLASIGYATLFIDGKQVVENVQSYKTGELFFNMGSEEVRGSIDLVAGTTYAVEVRQWRDPKAVQASPFAVRAGLRIGAYPDQAPAAALADAAALAKRSDVAIVIVGTNPDWESEGFDRKTIALPGESDALVRAVLAANPNTIVVTQSGTPVAMPWIASAPTVVQAFFGGNELGNALADVLFGMYNPSGKLPLTFPVRLEDNPTFHSFGNTGETPGKIVYGEGIYIGYRHYDRSSIAPLFPFGFGLSYTTFAFSDLAVSTVALDATFSVTFAIKNTGDVAGQEVAQVYISAPVEGRITSPLKELKGFKKVSIAPGQTEVVKIALEKSAFSYWDERRDSWVAPAGTYGVLVGSSSDSLMLVGEAVLEKAIMWRGL